LDTTGRRWTWPIPSDNLAGVKRLTLATVLTISCVALFATPAGAFQLKLFHTPDGNIGCAVSFGPGSLGGSARCDISEHDWKAPKKPAYCELDWGGGLAVDSHGRAGFVCAGDTTLHQGRKLAAGKSVSVGPYRCKSFGEAVRCVNRRTGHGFKLSRTVAERF
jgi:hypothetical protein